MRHSYRLVLVCTICAAVLMYAASTHAQGPQCPPGFVFDRNSGVGCVQVGCGDISQAHYSYTGACICNDSFKGCYQPVDYAGFDKEQCGPFCPFSSLTACVAAESACPGEQPAAQPLPGDSAGQDSGAYPADVPQQAGAPQVGAPPDSEAGPSLEEMTRILEESLVPQPAKTSAASRQALAAVLAAVGVLIIMLQILPPGIDDFDPQAVTTGPPAPDQAGEPAVKLPPPPARTPPLMAPDQQTLEKLRQSAQQAAQPARPLPETAVVTPEKVQALERTFQQLVDEKVKEGHYVMNTGLGAKVWNWTVGLARDKLTGEQGGQCGEMAHLGQGWIEGFVMKNFGREAIIDQIWIYERSSRYPENYTDYADALYAANHAATRVILPNGDSYILDFWQAIGDRQGEAADARSQARIMPEHQWIAKWRDAIGSAGDAAEVSNINAKQAALRDYLAQAGVRHPSQAAYLPREEYEQAVQTSHNAIQQWRLSRQRSSPVETEMLINNWYKYGALWGSDRSEPPADPGAAVKDGFGLVYDKARQKLLGN